MSKSNLAVKMAITVRQDVHAKVLRAATAENKSVSAWMTDAAHRAIIIREGLKAVAEWEAEHGHFTEDEVREGRKEIMRLHTGTASPKHKKRKG